MPNPKIPEVLKQHQATLLAAWVDDQLAAPTRRGDLLEEGEMRTQSQGFLSLLTRAVQGSGDAMDIGGPAFTELRDFLTDLSRSRSRQGFTPTETATFVLSFKPSLINHLRQEAGDGEAGANFEEAWRANALLDRLGLFTTEAFMKSREEFITRQQEEMLELSTPVVTLWPGILALPMIGTLDSNRTQVVMETLLQRIVETSSEIAILDITGVPTVDTLVAQHLLKTVAAARLMGADCIISGIRPQIAQTMVHLAIDLSTVITKASLADAFAVALRKVGLKVVAAGA